MTELGWSRYLNLSTYTDLLGYLKVLGSMYVNNLHMYLSTQTFPSKEELYLNICFEFQTISSKPISPELQLVGVSSICQEANLFSCLPLLCHRLPQCSLTI